MLKIGEFSLLAKLTIKTLRYYDEIGLFKPSFIDDNNYRYYDEKQLDDISLIVRLRESGFSIKDIHAILKGDDIDQIIEKHIGELKNQKRLLNNQILQTKSLKNELGGIMKHFEITTIIRPSFIGYERKGTIKGFSDLFGFVLESGAKAKKINPTIECGNYCYINYLDNEYKDKDINIAYVEETLSMGKENDEIKFKQFPEEKLLSLKYVGSYSHLRDAYKELLKYIKDNNITTKSSFREVYVDGCWNKDNEDDYLTLIEVVID